MGSSLLDIEQLTYKKRARTSQNTRSIDDIVFEPSAKSPLCRFCTTRGIWHHLSGKYIFNLADWVFGFITDPADVNDPERRDCPFCKLVFDVLPENAFDEEHRHNYRREGASKVYCSLRPIHIKVRKETFTSFVVAYNFLEYKSFSHKIFQNYRAWIGLDTNARRIFNTPGIAAIRTPGLLDPNLIQTWIHRCQRHHGHCSHKHREFSERSWSTLMIDVNKYCLVDGRTDCTYAALSYVWGQIKTLQTTRANLISLMTPGALSKAEIWGQIPQVVRDGILLTQAINIPYLWVDCLCIVQDDFARKYDQIARMDKIYLQAQITIMPYSGKNADTAIPGVRPDTRAVFSTPVSIPGCSDDEGLSMVLTSSPYREILQHDSIHESRAWTLQEKVLSVRCVFITRWGMWFQCLMSRYSDVGPGESPFQYTTEMPLLSLEKPRYLSSDCWEGWDASRMDEFLTFAQHVEWYTSRKLTFQTDRIDAFRGILNHFEEQCQQGFLWAHPEGSLLPISLLWIHVDVGRSRDAKGSPDDEATCIFYQDYLPDRDTEYPTWSWIGWSGRVSYSLALDLDDAGIDLRLDDDVHLVTQVAFDEDDARGRGVAKALSPNLFHRFVNRGTLELSGPTIRTADMCCEGMSRSMHITTLDQSLGTFALMSAVYPYYQEGSVTMRPDELKGEPCGAILGIPFWGDNNHENHRIVLLKTVPGSVGKLFKSHASFREMFESAGDDIMVCIAMLIWVSGRHAERKGIAILDRAFWRSRQPVVEEYFLL